VAEETAERALHEASETRNAANQELAVAEEVLKTTTARADKADAQLRGALKEARFDDLRRAYLAIRPEEIRAAHTAEIEAHRQALQDLASARKNLEVKLWHRRLSAAEWEEAQRKRADAEEAHGAALTARGAADEALIDMQRRHARWQDLDEIRRLLRPQVRDLEAMQGLLKGNKFVEFLAAEQLNYIARDASARLAQLTRFRYVLEVDSDGGFVIRDDGNGGARRPTSSLSGGETFLAALALALALSDQIQLRGRYPLEFFFLDEGFGSLDADALETVIAALERLHAEKMTVGIISHVPELQQRIPTRLLVAPAQPGGHGTRLRIEHA